MRLISNTHFAAGSVDQNSDCQPATSRSQCVHNSKRRNTDRHFEDRRRSGFSHQTGFMPSIYMSYIHAFAFLVFLLLNNAAADDSLLSQLSESELLSTRSRQSRQHYTNTWAVKVIGDADLIAAKHGMINLGEILPGSQTYEFAAPLVPKKSNRRKRSVTFELSSDPEIVRMEQQIAKVRVKRAFRAYREVLNDPNWNEMWYLNRGPGRDMGVQEAWEMGYTGKGVVITILDDGLETTHPDIADNYDPLASFDINDHDEDPTPRYDLPNTNRHGTRCAGEVAAKANNNVCVVGIAHEARIGGIRMLDGDVTDAVEARSLSHNSNHVDIYSASWGPDDDGKTVDGPARLAYDAFQQGIQKGRNGKGSIFVWASGNGGRVADSCNCDGYTNSIYTLSISSATEKGNVPWYSEACSSTLATTYSSGSHGERAIITTDLYNGCTSAHTGTSASAPIAAAIAALALQANPALTWRDLQHIVVRSARPDSLRASDWVVNGVGRNVSHNFGFGLMDASTMVRLARNWTMVPEQHQCIVPYREPGQYRAALKIPQRTKLQVVLRTDGCADDSNRRVIFLEHVQAQITLTAAKRGDLQIYLISPAGTRSVLLAKRARDVSRAGFRRWSFMTTHCWGEKANGEWRLEIENDGFDEANLLKWDLILYGTTQPVGVLGGVFSSLSAGASTAQLITLLAYLSLYMLFYCVS